MKEGEPHEPRSQTESFRKQETGNVGVLEVKERPIDLEKSKEEDFEKVQEIREGLNKKFEEEENPTSSSKEVSMVLRKVDLFVEKHLPSYLQKQTILANSYITLAKIAVKFLERIGHYKVEGREHVPSSGPCLLVSNHSRVMDELKIATLVNRPARVVGADIHFNTGFKRWLMKKFGVIEVPGTLSLLSEDEKQEVLERAPQGEKRYYQKVINRDKQSFDQSALRRFLKTTVASLAHGEPVVFFPEGLWTFEGHAMHRAYPGIEVIARQFEKLTGEKLPIVPIGISDSGVRIGEAMTLESGKTVDDVMKHVASLLPEDERGYYG